jgi:ADP-heptose:LPS heptosyltransferase
MNKRSPKRARSLPELGISRLLLSNIDHHLGNLLITLPVIQAFAERFDGELGVMVDERYSSLVRLLPGPMRVLEYPSQAKRRRGVRENLGPASVVLGMWRHRFGAVLDLYGGTRSVLLALSTLAPVRIGYSGHTRMSGLYTDTMTPQPGIHVYERYAYALNLLGDGRLPDWPVLDVPKSVHEQVVSRLAADFGKEDNRPIMVVHPGAGHEYRLWPAERFGRVCARLIDQNNLRVVIIGTPRERPLMEKVFVSTGRPADSSIWTVSLLELLGLFARSRLILSNESGPTHLASLTTLPIVTIFGPTREHLWRPVRKDNVWVLRGAECHPDCGRGACVDDWRCLSSLDERGVLAAVESCLEATG